MRQLGAQHLVHRGPAEVDVHVSVGAAELAEHLAADAAGRREVCLVGHHSHTAQLEVALRHGLGDRGALGAQRRRERGALDVAAREHPGLLLGEHRSTHFEV